MENTKFNAENVLKNLLKKPHTPYELYRKISDTYGNHMDSAFTKIIDTLSLWLEKGYISFSEGKYKLNI